MISVLLVDDEPLVLIGLQSMLRWEEHGLTVCGTARNGARALEMIDELHPEIVITDIKMPIKSGIEVVKALRERGESLPVFVMLTSFEEFGFVKDAIHFGAIEYLVKLELTQNTLLAAMRHAIARVNEIRATKTQYTSAQHTNLTMYRDKFFVRLYNNLFESRSQFLQQKADLLLDFSAARYAVAFCSLCGAAEGMSREALMTLYSGAMQMVRETVKKFVPSHVTGLDIQHFNILFCMPEGYDERELAGVLRNALDIVWKMFGVRMVCGIGKPCEDVFLVSSSYFGARGVLTAAPGGGPVLRESESEVGSGLFNMSAYKTSLTRAFEELDTAALHDTISDIVRELGQQRAPNLVALDAASSLLYMALLLLPEGESTLSALFAESPDGYRSLYRQPTAEECCRWMCTLRDGLCEVLQSRRQSYKERVVANVQEYIKSNLNKKLTLNDVAAAFSFSPNYLSQLFARYSDNGFVGYITDAKISAAKGLLLEGDKKIYEISELLGFESAFYFSKVFKKGTGQSPREYLQNSGRSVLS